MSPVASRYLSYLRPGSGVPGLVACLVVWVPLVAGALDLTFGGTHDFGRRWLISAVIADTVCFFCFGGALLAKPLLAAFTRRTNERSWEPTPAFYFGLAAVIMPAVLPLGLRAGAHVAALLGRSYPISIGSYRVGLGFGCVMTALFFLYRARADARERVRALENANLRAQLASLTAEMNPHLLFNALNTIASLVHHDPDRAEQTVLELAEVYRGVLRASSGTTHSLADELRLCEAYLRVETARFGDRLRVSISIDDAVDTAAIPVPILLLQPMVENAVKHGIAPRASGGTVTLRVVRHDSDAHPGIAVSVEDDGVGLGRSPARGNGRALANCKERLRLTYGEGASLELAARAEGGTRAHLMLPSLGAA